MSQDRRLLADVDFDPTTPGGRPLPGRRQVALDLSEPPAIRIPPWVVKALLGLVSTALVAVIGAAVKVYTEVGEMRLREEITHQADVEKQQLHYEAIERRLGNIEDWMRIFNARLDAHDVPPRR